jgi:hypothetical protein
MLTDAQKVILKADILANADTLAAYNIGNLDALEKLYNAEAAPAFVVWRTNIPVEDYREAIVWTEVDNAAMTVGKARIWEWLTANMTLPINAAKTNVRQGLMDCWPSNTTTRTQLTAVAKRNASRIEKLFATGTGSTASPATMVVEGPITYHEFIGL